MARHMLQPPSQAMGRQGIMMQGLARLQVASCYLHPQSSDWALTRGGCRRIRVWGCCRAGSVHYPRRSLQREGQQRWWLGGVPASFRVDYARERSRHLFFGLQSAGGYKSVRQQGLSGHFTPCRTSGDTLGGCGSFKPFFSKASAPSGGDFHCRGFEPGAWLGAWPTIGGASAHAIRSLAGRAQPR